MTADNNAKAKISYQERMAANKSCVDTLRKLFPKTFFNPGKQRPLKIGIHQDVSAALKAQGVAIDETTLRNAIKWYVSRISYLKACVLEADRLDLKGLPAGKVEVAHVENAEKKCRVAEQRKAKLSNKKQATLPSKRKSKLPKTDASKKAASQHKRTKLADVHKPTFADKWPLEIKTLQRSNKSS